MALFCLYNPLSYSGFTPPLPEYSPGEEQEEASNEAHYGFLLE